LTEEQHRLIKAAATHTGVSISAWTVMTLVRIAREQTERA
jgi:uncharacterized protein (DUF1778 family)